MADFSIAVSRTLQNEGGFIHNPVTGEVANFGITVWFLRSIGVLHGSGPASPTEIEFVRNMSREYAIDIYRRHFWGTFGALASQKLANKAFDLAVNMGTYSGIRLLQEALNDVTHGNYAVDGMLGPKTIHGCNLLDPVDPLYNALLARAEARYRAIAQHPLLAADLPDWLNRLHAA